MKSDRNWVYFITRIIVTIYFTLYHRLSVYGKEKIPRDRPVIIASNHASYLDPPVVGYAFFPGYLKFIAWDKLFSFRPFGAFLRAMGSVPAAGQEQLRGAAAPRHGLHQRGLQRIHLPRGAPHRGRTASAARGRRRDNGAQDRRARRPDLRGRHMARARTAHALPAPLQAHRKEKRRYILDKIEEFYKEQDAIDKAKHPLPERGAA